MSILGKQVDDAAQQAEETLASVDPDIALFNQTLSKLNDLLDAISKGNVTITIKVNP